MKKSLDSIARRVVADYYRNEMTVHKMLEREADAFDSLLDAISGTPRMQRKRLRERADVEQKLRAAHPELHADLEKLDDLYHEDLNDYLEAGYLIGLAVARRVQ